MQAYQRRNRTSGEDLVFLERREMSYRMLYANAAIVRYDLLIFFLMCCVAAFQFIFFWLVLYSQSRSEEGSEADQLLSFERLRLEIGAFQSQWFSGHSKRAFADSIKTQSSWSARPSP